MNKIKMTGICLIGLGTIEQAAGGLLASRRLQTRGFAHQVAGQSKLAIGTAMARIGERLHAVRTPAEAIRTGVRAAEPL